MELSEIQAIAARLGTPVLVYDGVAISSACRQVRGVVPSDFRILYSIKANPNQDVCRIISAEGFGAEVASLGELHFAIESGFDPASIAAAGPAKSERELESYVQAGIWLVHVESIRELRALDRIAHDRKVRQKVLLRVNPTKTDSGARVKMGGRPSQFGFDEENLLEVLQEARAHPHIQVVGFHAYVGTQVLSPTRILENARDLIGIARRAHDRLGQALEVINFGGGFGIPLAVGDAPLDANELTAGLDCLCRETRADSALRDVQLVIELGRYLVGTAGYLACKIEDVKISRGHRFVVLDGGINCGLALAPLLRFDRRPPLLSILPEGEDRGTPFDAQLVGPLCTSLDLLAANISLPKVSVGDLVVFRHVGAYGLTMSPILFLSREIAAEFVLTGRSEGTVTRRELRRTREHIDLK